MGATTSTVVVAAAVVAAAASSSSASSAASSAIGGLFSSKPGTFTLPMPNPLSSYASVNHIFSLMALNPYSFNFPAQSYLAGIFSPLILKSAGIDPTNRYSIGGTPTVVYMDDLEIKSYMSISEKLPNSGITQGSFKVVEPYSIGQFFTLLQGAANSQGYSNYNNARYLLMIQFRGNNADGVSFPPMQNISGITKFIPIKITKITMNATASGGVYQVQWSAAAADPLRLSYRQAKSDVTIEGKTVQEVLQTGNKSLQAVLNQRLKELAKQSNQTTQDTIVILFPKDTGTTQSGTSSGSATLSPGSITDNAALMTQLGVSASSTDSVVSQDPNNVNAIGSASLGFDPEHPGTRKFPNNSSVWDDKTQTWTTASVGNNPDDCTFQFNQGADMLHIINRVLILSSYANTALQSQSLTKDGFRPWWRIDTQVYDIPTTDNATGTFSQVMVYRIIPYAVHASKLTAVNVAPPGLSELVKQIPKVYNYIYTGQNSEVIDFEIHYENTFTSVYAADTTLFNQDVTLRSQNAGASNTASQKKDPHRVMPTQGAPSGLPGQEVPQTARYNVITGGGTGGTRGETEFSRLAEDFNRAANQKLDMINAKIRVAGDPFYIPNSGTGNYVGAQTNQYNVTADGDINYQNGEVHIVVNFRSPADINQSLGLYDWSNTHMAFQFSGYYQVIQVVSNFSNNNFTQTLICNRLPNQNNTAATTVDGKLLTTDRRQQYQGQTGPTTNSSGGTTT